MSDETLGELEQLVLIALLHLLRRDEDEVYGVPIMKEIERRTGRPVARPAVYVTLRRLERKGMVSSWMGEPRSERGGKARRCVDITLEGQAALSMTRRVMDRMWGDLAPPLPGDR